MTAIFYPDCDAASPSGRYALEARSPHNATIPHRDGRRVTDDEFGFKYREHQREFRYRLLDRAGDGVARVVWERWQDKAEDSPHELVVSDDGWSVIRTHGFSPEVIAVSPAGRDTIRVRVLGVRSASDQDGPDARLDTAVARYAWRAKHLAASTAGSYWAGHSWRYFLRHGGSDLFAWRTYWGQRLVLDLTRAALVAEEGQADPSLAQAMDNEERRGACTLLADLAAQSGEVERVLAAARGPERESVERHPLRPTLSRAVAALHLVGLHRVHAGLPFLRRWEAIDYPSYSTGSTAMPRGWWLEAQHFRPVVHHALRLLGVMPQGYATYHFCNGAKERLPMPERIVGRRERAADLDRGMSAEQVLGLIGSPDHVRRRSHPVGTLVEWTEDWEYDSRVTDQWLSLRITWEEHRRKGRIIGIEEGPANWHQSDDRVMELMRL